MSNVIPTLIVAKGDEEIIINASEYEKYKEAGYDRKEEPKQEEAKQVVPPKATEPPKPAAEQPKTEVKPADTAKTGA